MYKYDEIKVVHLEPTTKCNASCSQCLRSANGGEINPYLPITELSLNDVKKIFPISFVAQLRSMNMCINYQLPKEAVSVKFFLKTLAMWLVVKI